MHFSLAQIPVIVSNPNKSIGEEVEGAKLIENANVRALWVVCVQCEDA